METATQQELRKAGEIELSRDEDSVMCLAVGPRKGRISHLYAGINSSAADIAKGQNKHLRTFAIEQSRSRASAGTKVPDAKIAKVVDSGCFVDPDPNTYQRLLRVAGPMGAAATAMGQESQLAVFEAAGPKPTFKGVLEIGKDAEDLDIVQTDDNEFQVAYCHKYELHVVNIGKQNSDSELVYSMPTENGDRPQFRSIRYLSPKFILAVANLPRRSGMLITGYRLPSPGHPKARVAISVRIPGNISATALAVANLAPPASPTALLGDTQFIIAVAGNDSSISLYTMTHKTDTTIETLKELYPLYTLKNVHGNDNITGVAFSHFTTPKTHIRDQFIKLASISLQKSVSVQSIELKKHVDKTRRNPKGPPRPVRYEVKMKSQAPSPRSLLMTLGAMVLIMAVLGQVVLEMLGQSPPLFRAHKYLPSWHGTLRSFDPPPPGLLQSDFMAKLAGDKKPAPGETLVLVEQDHPFVPGEVGEEQPAKKINLDVHNEEVHGPGKEWHELGDEQKEAWKERLHAAGARTQDLSEGVLKGLLFGELAGVVGRAMGG